jgi:hypothetical protein
MNTDRLQAYLYQNSGPDGQRGRFSAANDKEAFAKLEAMGFGGAKLFNSDGTEVSMKQHMPDHDEVNVEPVQSENLVPLPPGFTHPPKYDKINKPSFAIMTTHELPKIDKVETPIRNEIESKNNVTYKRRLLWGEVENTAKSVNEILEKKNGTIEHMEIIIDGKGKTLFFAVMVFEETHHEDK